MFSHIYIGYPGETSKNLQYWYDYGRDMFKNGLSFATFYDNLGLSSEEIKAAESGWLDELAASITLVKKS